MQTNAAHSPSHAPRIIISGGGTGGHIFPAISIANAIKEIAPAAEILFVGAQGRMEMEKVPAAGYKIIGLEIQGIQRSLTLKNLLFPIKLIKSLWKAWTIVRDFKPHAAVGVGGYASGPMLYAASLKGIPYLIQEQNSYAGITNKILGKKAKKVCVAFEGMEQFFPKENILLTGNPVRGDFGNLEAKKEEALSYFQLKKNVKTILILGGSLGARTLNQSVLTQLTQLTNEPVQLLWQCGKLYHAALIDQVKGHANIHLLQFIDRMDLAYAAADVVISRAGAGTISELCLVGKPVVLVPSPNVAEDHQTKNAMALVNKHAALLVKDAIAPQELISITLSLLQNEEKQALLAQHIKELAKADAAMVIAKEVLSICKNK